MYTQCPNCSALFRVSGDQLRSAGGHVRCGGCQKVFYALDSLTERLEDFSEPAVADDLFIDELMDSMDESEEETPLSFPDETIAGGLRQISAGTHDDRPGLFVDEVTAAMRESAESARYPTVTDEVPDDDDLLLPDDSEEEDTRPVPETPAPGAADSREVPLAIRESPTAARPAGRQTAAWLLAIGVLILVLLGQTVYFKHDELARRYPQLRPGIEKFCRHAGCRLGTTADITRIHIIDRQVRSHPDHKGALQVVATFASASQLAQPFPDIELAMSDRQGSSIAARRFTPREYLVNTALIHDGMQPRTPYRLHLELEDPGVNAVGFSFSFHEGGAG